MKWELSAESVEALPGLAVHKGARVLLVVGALLFCLPALFAQAPEGYAASQVSASGFTPLSGATVIYASDAALGGVQSGAVPQQVNLPFPFVFYGVPQSSVWVMHNGWMQFSSSMPTYTGDNQSATNDSVSNRISAFWDSFTFYQLNPPGPQTFPFNLLPQGPRLVVSHKVEGTAPFRTWTLEFLNMVKLISASSAVEKSCQVVLTEDGDVHYRFPPGPVVMVSGLNATVGITGIQSQGGVNVVGGSSDLNYTPAFNYKASPIRAMDYYESFESGPSFQMGWKVSTSAGAAWEWGSPVAASLGPQSGANGTTSVWKTSVSGPVTGASMTILESPRVKRGNAVPGRLNFFMHLDSQSGVSGGRLEVSKNNGPFVTVLPTDTAWVNGAPNSASVSSLGSGGWSGSISGPHSGFQRVTLNLDTLSTPGLTGSWGSGGYLQARFVFASPSNATPQAGWTIDDFRVGNEIVEDVSPVSVESPATGIGNGGAETLRVGLRNRGGFLVTAIPVTASIAGPPGTALTTLSGTWTGSLTPSQQAVYSLPGSADLSRPGTYTITVTTMMGSDAVGGNDVLVIDAQSVATVSVLPYFADFDNGNPENVRLVTAAGTYPGASQPGPVGVPISTLYPGQARNTSGLSSDGSRNGTGALYLNCSVNQPSQQFTAAAADLHFDLSGHTLGSDRLVLSWSRRQQGSFGVSAGNGVFASLDNGATWSVMLYKFGQIQASVDRYWADERADVTAILGTANQSAQQNLLVRFQLVSASTEVVLDDIRLERVAAGLWVKRQFPLNDSALTLSPHGGTLVGLDFVNLSASPVNITGVNLALTGSIDGSGISSVQLIEDLDRTRTSTLWDPVLATLNVQGSLVTGAVTGLQIGPGEIRRILVVANLLPVAAGRTVGVSIGTGSFALTPGANLVGDLPLPVLIHKVPPLLRTPYASSFEDNSCEVEGWGIDGQSGDIWERGVPQPFSTIEGPGPSSAKTGSSVFGTRLSGPPILGQSVRDLVSPSFSLQGTIDPVVSFWLWTRDAGMAFLLQRNGGLWTAPARNDPAWILNAPNGNISWNSEAVGGWNSNFSLNGSWVRVSMRLSSIITTPSLVGINSSDSIRFKFSWRRESRGGTDIGVFIDDFEISEFGSPVAPPAWAPTVGVSIGGVAVADNGSVSVPQGASVASRNVSITVSGAVPTIVQAFILGAGAGNGIVPSEWGQSIAAASHIIAPQSGTFNSSGYTHQVLLKIFNGSEFVERRFSIVVGPPSPATVSLPAISAEPSELVTMPLAVSWVGGEPVSAASFRLKFNSGKIEFLSAAIGSAQSTQLQIAASDTGGTLSISLGRAGTNVLISPGVAAQLQFRVRPNATPGTNIVEIIESTTWHAAGMPLHGLGGTPVIVAPGQVAVSVVQPTLRVLWGQFQFPVSNGGIIPVPYRSLLSAAGIVLRIEGRPNEQLTISTVLPSNATGAGLSVAEFSASGVQSAQASLQSGQFLVPGAVYTFTVTGASPSTSEVRSFTIIVGPNTPATIRATANGAPISAESSSIVPIGTTLSSLGLSFVASDPDGDPVTLQGTISNVTSQGFNAAQLGAQGTPAVANPIAGTFSVPGISHVFELTADDGIGGNTTFRFTLSSRANTSPHFSVTAAGIPVAAGIPMAVPYNTTLASLDLLVRAADDDGDPILVSAVVSGQVPAGFSAGEFSSGGASSVVLLRPVLGRFGLPNSTFSVTVGAADPYGASATFELVFGVGPNQNPALSVTSSEEILSPNQVLNVPYGASLASLGLAFTVRDPDTTAVSLGASIGNLSFIQSLSLTEWSSSSRDGPYTKSPLSGFFTTPDITHAVTLTADDGDGGVTALTFTIAVGSNAEPVLTVTSNGQPALAAYGLSPGTNLASLGLTASASNPDPYERLTLSLAFSGDPIPGFTDMAFNSLAGAASLSVPAATLFDDNATHTLTFSAADEGGNIQTRAVTIYVGSDVRLSTAVLPAATVGQQYSAKLAAVLGTPPYAFSSPDLPEWLNLESATGILSGTPPRGTASGTVNLTFSVTDSGPLEPSMDTVALPLRIEAPVPVDIVLLPPGALTQPANPVPILFADVDGMRNRVTEVDLPFPVTYFGTTYQSLWVSTNGWVSFSDPNGNSFPSNSRVSSPAGPLNAVFLFWDQLEFTAASSITIGSATANGTTAASPPVTNAGELVVIAYTNLAAFGQPGTSMSGQIVFDTGDGDVRLEYPQTGQNWTNATATIGMRGPYPGQSADPFNLGAQASNPPTSGVAFAVPSVATLVTQSIPGATQFAAYQTTLVAHGGAAPYVWVLSDGPDWLSIDSLTGTLSGSPGASDPGSFPIIVTVTESGGTGATATLTLTVAPGTAPVTSVAPVFDSGCVLGSGSGGLCIVLLVIMAITAFAFGRRRAAHQPR